jgi:hypothetical protein
LALQKLPELEEELKVLAEDSLAKKQKDIEEGKEDLDAYSAEYRVRMYQETQDKKEKDAQNMKDNSMFKDFHEMEEQMKNVTT